MKSSWIQLMDTSTLTWKFNIELRNSTTKFVNDQNNYNTFLKSSDTVSLQRGHSKALESMFKSFKYMHCIAAMNDILSSKFSASFSTTVCTSRSH